MSPISSMPTPVTPTPLPVDALVTFDETTRIVLKELSETVASALAGIGRKNALVSPTVVRTEYDITDPTFVLTRLAREVAAAPENTQAGASGDGNGTSEPELTYRGRARQTEDGTEVFVAVERALTSTVVATTDRLVVVTGAQVVTEDEHWGVVQVWLSEPFFAPESADHGAVLRSVTATPDSVSVVVNVPDGVTVGEISEFVCTRFEGVSLNAKRRLDRDIDYGVASEFLDTVTDRQLEVAQTAYYAGFFESPRGRARIERRSRLSVAAPELSATALNNVVVRAPPPADPVNRKTVGLDVFVGTGHVGTYHGDGVVVSTATGSTGLSLSVGGPVHDPQRSETVQTVPLATHSLGVRPLVVGSETPVTVVPNRPAVAIVDGGQRHHELAAETPIRVDGTAPPAELVATSVDDSFYDTLGDQLGWHVRENGPATESAAAPAERVVGGATNDRPETGFDVEYETPVDLGRALRVAVDAVESVAGPLRRRHGDVERERHKTDNADIVTEADRFAEETITAILEAEFPACGCLSEERGTTDRDGVATWVVDPLDGTSNYANGNPNY